MAGAPPGAPESADAAPSRVDHRAPLCGRHPVAPDSPGGRPFGRPVGGKAHRRRGGRRHRQARRGDYLGEARHAARDRVRDRHYGRGLVPTLGAVGELAGRSLREPDQRGPHAARRHPRPGAVRGPGSLRQAGAGAAADGQPDRVVHAAALDPPGPDHAPHALRRAGRLCAVAPGAARDRGPPVPAGRNALRRAGLLAALLVDARAAPPRLSPLRGRQRHLGQGGEALRTLGLSRGTVRPLEPGILRRQQGVGRQAEPRVQPARGRGDARLLRRLRRHHLSHGDRASGSGRAVHHRRAHLSDRIVPPEPRPHPAGVALADPGLRAEPLPGRPLQFLRAHAADSRFGGGPAGAGADPGRFRV